MKPEHSGTCASCREWTHLPDDERHVETLPGEPVCFGWMGRCATLDDCLYGNETCPEWTKREEP